MTSKPRPLPEISPQQVQTASTYLILAMLHTNAKKMTVDMDGFHDNNGIDLGDYSVTVKKKS